MPYTVIDKVNALIQGQHNYLDLFYCKKHPFEELNITVVDAGETEAPHIELVEPETDLDPIFDGAETLPELVEQQEMHII